MKLLFIDESGDNGVKRNSLDKKDSSKLFILAGLSLESCEWKKIHWKIDDVRRDIKKYHGINNIEEIKGDHIFRHEGCFYNKSISGSQLKKIYQMHVDLIFNNYIHLFVLVKSKEDFLKKKELKDTNSLTAKRIESLKKEFLEHSLRSYFERYNYYLIQKSLEDGVMHNGLVYYDRNYEKYVRKVVREYSRRRDEKPEYSNAGIIEDPLFPDSKSSLMIQLGDIVATSFKKFYLGYDDKDEFKIDKNIVKEFMNRNMMRDMCIKR